MNPIGNRVRVRICGKYLRGCFDREFPDWRSGLSYAWRWSCFFGIVDDLDF